MDAFIPEIVANVALGRLRNSSVLLPTVTRNSELTPATVGKKILVPRRGTVTSHDKVAGTAVTPQNPMATQVEVTLDTHKEVTFILEDVAAAMANPDALNGYVEDGMIELAERIDAAIIAEYAKFDGSVGVAGTDVDADLVVDARKVLNDAKAPLSERYLVVSTKDEAALLKEEKFTSAQIIADAGQAMREAFLGRKYGFNILVHQGIVETGSSPSATHNIAYQRGAIVVATRPLPLAPEGMGAKAAYVQDPESGLGIRVTYSYDTDLLGLKVTLDVLYGVDSLRSEFGCEVLA
jgi:hypothetical protein